MDVPQCVRRAAQLRPERPDPITITSVSVGAFSFLRDVEAADCGGDDAGDDMCSVVDNDG